jgi:hypothetical protein
MKSINYTTGNRIRINGYAAAASLFPAHPRLYLRNSPPAKANQISCIFIPRLRIKCPSASPGATAATTAATPSAKAPSSATA